MFLEVKFRLCNQFTKSNKGLFQPQITVDKKLSQLGYETLSNNKQKQGIIWNGYKLDPSLSNKKTKVFHNPTNPKVSVVYICTTLNPAGGKILRMI